MPKTGHLQTLPRFFKVSHVNARPCIIENYKLYLKGETK